MQIIGQLHRHHVHIDKRILEENFALGECAKIRESKGHISGQSVGVAVSYTHLDTGLAKLYCSRTVCEVLDDAIQVLAGIGIVGEHRVARYYIDTRACRIAGGTDEVMIFNTAPQILKRYR